MTVLVIGKPVEQSKPVLLVETKLAVGRHRFSLVVVNTRGVESEPATLVVTVRRGTVIGPTGLAPTKTRRSGKSGQEQGPPP
jgi:hypothetical protein